MVPNRKVTAGALAGSITVIGVFMVRELTGLEIPGEVASAITVVFTFITSYFVHD